MKRLLVLAFLALGLSVVATPAASPAGGSDAHGPPCANITNADWSYSLSGVIDFTVSLQAPACSIVTYSIFVTGTNDDALASSNTPDSTDSTDPACAGSTPGGGCVHYSINLGSTSPSTVCVYATTQIHGHLADLAPNLSDPGCPLTSSPSISLTKGGSGASGTFG
jgi:hypothetical protein